LSLRADPRTDAADVRARATAKLEEVDAKIRQLQRIREALEALVAACPGHGALGGCSIMDALAANESPDAGGARFRTGNGSS